MATRTLNKFDRTNSLGEVEHVTEVLKVEGKHKDGKYYVSVNKMEEVKKDGEPFTWNHWLPMAEGNFHFTVTTGRLSQKKLAKINEVLDDSIEELFNLWYDKCYQEIINQVVSKLVFGKVIKWEA